MYDILPRETWRRNNYNFFTNLLPSFVIITSKGMDRNAQIRNKSPRTNIMADNIPENGIYW
jgi:hypothetical protein